MAGGGISVMSDKTTPHFFREVFCSELPSPCNLYHLSGTHSARRHAFTCHHSKCGKKSHPVVRFATERHSLALLQRACDEAVCGNRGRGDGEYSLSVARLPSPTKGILKPTKATSKTKTIGASGDGREESGDICLAHSSLAWGDRPKAHQVRFEVESVGKTIAATKRRIQFIFGFHRDKEHELIVRWSFCSGKQSISLDGTEIFCNDGYAQAFMGDAPPPANELQYSWRDEAGHMLELKIFATGRSLEAESESNSCWRQYDFFIDGVSFFDLPTLSEKMACECHYPTSSVEVFAMTKIPSAEYDAKDSKTSDSKSVTTHGSHSVSEGGKDVADQKSTDASGTSAQNELYNDNQHYLIVRSRISLEKEGKDSDEEEKKKYLGSSSEIVPLDFRPLAVHVAEVYISTDTDSVTKSPRCCCSAIGIFVTSVDDNKLRLFVTTKDALKTNIAECNTTARCFDRVVQGNIEPLLFSTPIMNVDTCITEELRPAPLHSQRNCHVGLNQLAVACYDGCVRILTYQLKVGKDSHPSFHNVQSSSFVVDGPIASLHFGTVGASEIPLPQTSSLFLVAGSLCGFACLFYESPTASSENSSQSVDTLIFEGPVAIVDGLFDAREGHEDCVTSVHAFCGIRNKPIIAVGTHGGRLLFFQQYQKEVDQKNNQEQIKAKQQEKHVVQAQIDDNKMELSQLQSEIEEMEAKTKDLGVVVSELESKIKEFNTKVADSGNLDSILRPEINDNADAASISLDGEPAIAPTTDAAQEGNTEQSSINAVPISADVCSLESDLKSAQSELSHCKQQLSDHFAEISALTSTNRDLIAAVSTDHEAPHLSGPTSMCQNSRKIHRYNFLSESDLYYPIQGIASSPDGHGGHELLVSTRRSFHVFRDFSSDSNALVTDAGEKLEKMLAGRVLRPPAHRESL